MKRVGLVIMVLCMCHMVFSQETVTEKPEARNEIKVNLLMTVAFKSPEINYEHIFSNNLGLGIAAAVALDNDNAFDLNYLFTPYCRFYFGSKPAKGFFIEGNMAFVGFKDEYYTYYSSYYESRNDFGFGLGFAIGGKFINSNGFIGEFFGGLGSNIGSDSNSQFYPRIGVSIGKQF